MHVVSFDFQSDVTSCGRHIRFFNVVDEYTRTALAIIPRRSFKAADVVAVLEDIIAETGGILRCEPRPGSGMMRPWGPPRCIPFPDGQVLLGSRGSTTELAPETAIWRRRA